MELQSLWLTVVVIVGFAMLRHELQKLNKILEKIGEVMNEVMKEPA